MTKKQVAAVEDIERIFELVRDPTAFEDLQIMLQTLEFDVNNNKDRNGDLLVHIAVQQGMSHLAVIMNLVLVHEADVEAVDHNGLTPLCIAAKLGYEILTEVLVCVLGADPNAYSIWNHWTPLHYAAKANYVSIIECLARRGADMNAEDRFGFRADDTTRMVAQHTKDLIKNLRFLRGQHLTCLTKHGNLSPGIIRPLDMFSVDSEGQTLVMAAAQMNRCDNLMVLLHNERCPIDAQETKNGQTALSLAAMSGKADAVQTLLRYGAHPGIGDMCGMTPLHHACLNTHVQCVQAIVNVASGLTGLAKAVGYTDEPEICSIIKEAMKRRQKTIVNPTLFECAMNGDGDRLYSTLEEGDDVNPLTGTGDWPLYMAVGNGYLKILQLLHMNGGDICRHHQTTGSTALHMACSRGHYHIVSYILKVSKINNYLTSLESESCVKQWDINAVDLQGQTALQVAAEKGYSRIVKSLLDYGATSALIDSHGQPYKVSQYEGVQFLIERHQRSRIEQITTCIKNRKYFNRLTRIWQCKYDHNLRNHKGDTPLMIACFYGKSEVVKFLLKSAIQSTEEDHDCGMLRSVHKERTDSFVDSGAFDESNPECSNQKMLLDIVDEDHTDFETSVTDVSDQETGSDRTIKYTGQGPRLSANKGFSSSVNLGGRQSAHNASFCQSYDSQALEDSYEDNHSEVFKKYPNYQRFSHNRKAQSTNDLKDRQTIGSLSMKDYTADSPIADTINPRIYQGTSINHLHASNLHDGSTAMHRAVECIDEKKGQENVLLLLRKDPSTINLQNFKGFSPLHLAAKKDRKQIVKTIVSVPTADLNLRTADGQLAEDKTRSKRLAQVIRTARQDLTEKRSASSPRVEGIPTTSQSNVGGASIDFDQLEERFKKLRKTNCSK
ncbi:uncharacterized protein [Asterias amurensis]